MLSTDFQNRYGNASAPTISSGLKFTRKFYEGQDFIEKVEEITAQLLQELFYAKYADYRPLGGNVCDLAAVLALSKHGDVVMTVSRSAGGHFPVDAQIAALGRKAVHFPFDSDNHTIDLRGTEKEIERSRPSLLLLDSPVILFPLPVSDLARMAKEVDANVAYDGAHVLGLIAGRCFQDPLGEGAVALFGSTAKTFPGPQGGVFLSNAENKILQKIDETICPIVHSNYHQAKVAALGVAAAEMIRYGRDYATQVINNAKTLASSLHLKGFAIPYEHRGFTQSHEVLIDCRKMKSKAPEASRVLSKCNIITTRCPMPWDGEDETSGLRLGTSELTRLGMKEDEMEQIAEIFRQTLTEEKSPEIIAAKVAELMDKHQTISYSFDEGMSAYDLAL